jgi:NMD protein affecting ribosome stability and mRNA decay
LSRGNTSVRSLFSSKSGKRKIKLIKNVRVVKAVREKVVRDSWKPVQKNINESIELTNVKKNLKFIASKNLNLRNEENMFSPESRFNRKNNVNSDNSNTRLSVRVS